MPPENSYESNFKPQITNMKTLPNTPQVDLICNENDEILRCKHCECCLLPLTWNMLFFIFQLSYASPQASYPPQVSYTTYEPSAVQRTPVLIVDNRPRCRYCGELGPPSLVSARPLCMAWVFFFILLLLFWPICWVPLVVCHKRDYRCPHCKVSWGVIS